MRSLLVLLPFLVACGVCAYLLEEQAKTARQLNTINALEDQVTLLRTEVQSLRSRFEGQSDPFKQTSNLPVVAKSTTSEQNQNETPIREISFTADSGLKDDPFLGKADAPFNLIMFTSFQCKTCGEFFKNTFPKIREDLTAQGKVKFILRDFPLESHLYGKTAAQAASCAGEQGKYWEMAEILYAHDTAVSEGRVSSLSTKIKELDQKKFSRCMKTSRYQSEIAKDIEAGMSLGIKGLPSFFLGTKAAGQDYQGVFIRGAQPYEVFAAEIDEQKNNK